MPGGHKCCIRNHHSQISKQLPVLSSSGIRFPGLPLKCNDLSVSTLSVPSTTRYIIVKVARHVYRTDVARESFT
jgi:hypothetical protein